MRASGGKKCTRANRARETSGRTKPHSHSVLNKKLRDYRLLKKLGRGGFGDVWLAQTTLDGDKRALVAVKVVRRSKLGRSVFPIEEEQRLLELFSRKDPGLGYFPQLIESFTDEHNLYLVQEYIPGGTLRDELKRNRHGLSLQRVKFVMAQMLTILRAMHELGIVHRDIKPENILIDALGNVVLADFGLASDLATVRRGANGKFLRGAPFAHTDSHCGTLGYIAPEIWSRKKYKFSVDLYALGVIFFEMVFGMHPFPQYESSDMVCAMMNYDFARPLRILPPAMADLMFKLLINDPNCRINVWQAMLHPFFKDIDWTLVSNRMYELPTEWAPPVERVRKHAIKQRVLIDKNPRRRSGRCRNASIDRAFTMSRRVPTVKRPVPRFITRQTGQRESDMRRKHVSALRAACKRRVQAGSPDPRPDQPPRLPELTNRNSAGKPGSLEEGEVAEHEKAIKNDPRQTENLRDEQLASFARQDTQLDEDGKIAKGSKAHEIRPCANSILVSSRTLAVDSPRRPPAIVIPDACAPMSQHRLTSGFSLFNVSIKPVDEILLSATPGMGLNRVLAFEAPASSFQSSSAASSTPTEQSRLTPPLVSVHEETPPITPYPVTPISENFDVVNEEVTTVKTPASTQRHPKAACHSVQDTLIALTCFTVFCFVHLFSRSFFSIAHCFIMTLKASKNALSYASKLALGPWA